MSTQTSFTHTISEDGDFKPESGRYHLYISYGCPFAHRASLTRILKGLEDAITLSSVRPGLDKTTGWSFSEEYPDPINNFSTLREVYHQTDPNYSGRVTVPVLYDKKNKVIVNNESAEILRILNNKFNEFAKNPRLDLYSEELRNQIDDLNSWIQPGINLGVYGPRDATNEEEYEKAKEKVFNSLDRAEAILEKSKFLTGDKLTEADVRLWPSLLRFDPAYYTTFKLNKKHLSDYPNLTRFLNEIKDMDGVESTIDMHHIIKLYCPDRV